jgi:hypothetical protein
MAAILPYGHVLEESPVEAQLPDPPTPPLPHRSCCASCRPVVNRSPLSESTVNAIPTAFSVRNTLLIYSSSRRTRSEALLTTGSPVAHRNAIAVGELRSFAAPSPRHDPISMTMSGARQAATGESPLAVPHRRHARTMAHRTALPHQTSHALATALLGQPNDASSPWLFCLGHAHSFWLGPCQAP